MGRPPISQKQPSQRWEAFHGENKNILTTLSGGKNGLTNLGNTCFMNAGLQCLAHVEPITAYFLSDKYKEEVNTQGNFTSAFADLLHQIWKKPKKKQPGAQPVSPNEMHKAMKSAAPHLMQGYEQQDVQEFLSTILGVLSDDLNLVKEKPERRNEEEQEKILEAMEKEHGEEVVAAYHWQQYLMHCKSFLVDICQGQLRSVVKCTICGHASKTFEPYVHLSLPVALNMMSVDDAFRSYLSEETLDGDERWHCTHCKEKVVATKKIDIYNLPNVLILHLKRFAFDRELNTFTKVSPLLKTSLTVDLSEYIISDSKEPLIYDIVAVANHRGQFGKGHYTATCKHRIDDKYYNFDDRGVNEVKNSDVITNQAYVLFLIRREREGTQLRRQTTTLADAWPHWVSIRDSQIVPNPRIEDLKRHSVAERPLPRDSLTVPPITHAHSAPVNFSDELVSTAGSTNSNSKLSRRRWWHMRRLSCFGGDRRSFHRMSMKNNEDGSRTPTTADLTPTHGSPTSCGSASVSFGFE